MQPDVRKSALTTASPVLARMFETGTSVDENGDTVALSANIPEPWAEALYQRVLVERPAVCLEVGMGFGVSTLALLTGLAATGGHLISIDPKQQSVFGGAGMEAVRRAGLADRHRLVEARSDVALPQLVADGTRIDLAYIDGWHTFDYVLLDYLYIDRMLQVGGIVGFNDCEYPAVHRVIRFVETHRRYEEVDLGLPIEYVGASRSARLRARLAGLTDRQAFPSVHDRYFRKIEEWEPAWDYYRPF